MEGWKDVEKLDDWVDKGGMDRLQWLSGPNLSIILDSETCLTEHH